MASRPSSDPRLYAVSISIVGTALFILWMLYRIGKSIADSETVQKLKRAAENTAAGAEGASQAAKGAGEMAATGVGDVADFWSKVNPGGYWWEKIGAAWELVWPQKAAAEPAGTFEESPEGSWPSKY